MHIRPLTQAGINIKTWLQRDWVAISLYAVATFFFTYPIAIRLGDPWIATRDADTFVKIWDNWWLQNLAFNEPSLFSTNILFYPQGLSLSYHSISWTVAFLSWAFSIVTDTITAYNITILVAVFSTAYAAYLLVRPFVHYGAAAWLAGAIYSFAPYHISHSGGHPDLVHLAPIPLAVLLIFTAIKRPSKIAALGAALMVGLAGFTSLYIMVFALLTVGPVLFYLLVDNGRWAERRVWNNVLLFVLVSAILLTIRLVPIFRDTGALDNAINLEYAAYDNQTDALSFVLPSHLNPLFAPYTQEIATEFGYMSGKWPAYLGFIPLVLSVVALFWKQKRKEVLLWFSIGLIFLVLSLGPALRFNGNLYPDFILPARLLSWFPPIRAVGRPDLFVTGLLLPLSLLAAYGLDRILIKQTGNRVRLIVLMMVIPGILLAEFWSGAFPGVSSEVNPFYRKLAQEPDDFAIIQLPMGRMPSKDYLYYQTVHQKPIVEGLIARTPHKAYGYIANNYLLQSWSRSRPLDCSIQSQRRIMSSLDELIDDGFRYVIVHHTFSDLPVDYLAYLVADPFYRDGELTAYRLADLRDQPPCTDRYQRVFDLPSPENVTSILWDQKIKLLGYNLSNVDRATETLPVTVYWQASTEMERSYISFFHLIDAESGVLVAQADVIPRGWSYPTSWWMAGEVVEDTVQIPVEKIPPGRYELFIGWYDEETGTRLQLSTDQHRPVTEDSIMLAVIKI